MFDVSYYPARFNQIKCIDKFYRGQLYKAAAEAAQRFMAPIYLVGSAIGGKEPSDIDLILVVTEDQYTRLIGPVKDKNEEWSSGKFGKCYHRLTRFIQKQKSYFEGFIYTHDIDFKIVHVDRFHKGQGPRIRLDPFEDIF